jgi:hypothetical protein
MFIHSCPLDHLDLWCNTSSSILRFHGTVRHHALRPPPFAYGQFLPTSPCFNTPSKNSPPPHFLRVASHPPLLVRMGLLFFSQRRCHYSHIRHRLRC